MRSGFNPPERSGFPLKLNISEKHEKKGKSENGETKEHWAYCRLVRRRGRCRRPRGLCQVQEWPVGAASKASGAFSTRPASWKTLRCVPSPFSPFGFSTSLSLSLSGSCGRRSQRRSFVSDYSVNLGLYSGLGPNVGSVN